MMKKNFILLSIKGCIILFLIVSYLFLFSSCRNQGIKSEAEIVSKTPVTIIEPVYKEISEVIYLPAVTSYLIKNTVRSTATGIIETIKIIPGANVTKGELLFTLKTLEAVAYHDTLSGSSNLGFRGVINILSPCDGVITSVSHQGADYVQEGDELATVSDLNSLIFILEVPFELTEFIGQGKTCTLILPDSTRIIGRIKSRLPEMNIQNQTVSYFISPLSGKHFPQNLIASAAINKGSKKDAIVVPKPAVLGNETQTEFWVMKLINDSTAVKIPVKKGVENFEEVEIIYPRFLPTDKILFSGNYGLPDTASVIVNN